MPWDARMRISEMGKSMHRTRSGVSTLFVFLAALISCALTEAAIANAGGRAVPGLQLAQASADPAEEKAAFEAAKELGTVEAWDAFLTNYPNGFRADLARAYVKKLASEPSPLPSAPAGANQPNPTSSSASRMMKPSIGMIELAPLFASVADISRAAKLPCSEAGSLSSRSSTEAARISFINYSPDPIDVYWIDESGAHQLYGQINKGRKATVETFVSQPWIVKYLDGSCVTIAMPNPGPQIFPIGEALGSAPAEASKLFRPTTCGSGQIRVEGKCMSRSSAIGYCGPGFRVSGGKCVQQSDLPGANKPSTRGCRKGQIWSAQEGCHYDD